VISLLLALFAITLLAYAVKAATGFGPALVVVSLGSVVVGPLNAVILAAFLDLASGAGVLWLDRRRPREPGWVALAATMSVGAIAGSLLLGVIPTPVLGRVVAVGIIGFGAWMLFSALKPARTDAADGSERAPTAAPGRQSRAVEHAVVAGGGVAGGLIGVGGPPLVLYFGSRLPRERFRSLIVPILLAAAVFRAATYGAMGQVDGEVLVLLAGSLPALPLGLALGDHLFRRWSERGFRVAVAVLVTAAGVRLLF